MSKDLAAQEAHTNDTSHEPLNVLLAALKDAHTDELQRNTLALAERIRQSEVARLKAEEEYEALEERNLATLDERLNDIGRLTTQLADLHDRLDRAAQQRETSEEKRFLLQSKLQQVSSDADRLKEALAAGSKEAGQLKQQVQELTERSDVSRRQLAERSEALTHAEQLLEATRQKLSEQKITYRHVADELTTLQLQHTELTATSVHATHRGDALEQQLTEARATHQALEMRLGEQQLRSQALDARTQALASSNASLSNALSGSENDRKSLAAQIQALSHAREGTAQELDRVTGLLKLANERHAKEGAERAAQLAASQQEVLRHRSALVQVERKVEASKRTISFQLGQALIHASKNWTAAFTLPRTLYQIRREAVRRGLTSGKTRRQETHDVAVSWVNDIDRVWASDGIVHAEQFVERNARSTQESAAGLTRLARLVLRVDAQEACRLGQLACALDPRPFRTKWFGFLLFDAGHVLRAHEVLCSLPSDIELKPSERNKRLHIEGCADLLLHSVSLPQSSNVPLVEAIPGRMLYVASSALPHHTSGYTVRTQGLLRAWQEKGREVLCAVRPGYPNDRDDVHAPSLPNGAAVAYELANVQYQLLPGPHRRRMATRDYIEASATALEELARRWRPAVIQAASNHESALPALLAARRLGIPFVYEVRGLWEYTAASKIPGWESTERFALEKQLESLVASEANQVFTLTAALAEELTRRGVDAKQLALVPNAVDANTAAIQQRDTALAEQLGIPLNAFVVGYLGSVVGYEGLDDLVTAMADVVRTHPDARLLVVGDGEALPAIKAQVSVAGLGDAAIFTGRVPATDVMRYYSCMNVVALPRKPVTVCQLVSPIKPLEVMAAGLPLVVSDVQALREMVSDGTTGLVYRAGDAAQLAQKLLELAQDTDKALQLGRAGRVHALANCSWTRVVDNMAAHIDALVESGGATASAGSFAGAMPTDLTSIQVPAGRNSLSAEDKSLLLENLRIAAGTGGATTVLRYLHDQTATWGRKLRTFAEIKGAQALLAIGDTASAFSLSDQALQHGDDLGTLRAALRVRYNGGDLSGALTLVQRLRPHAKEADTAFLDEVEGRACLVNWASAPPQRRTLPIKPRRVLNLLAFSLPYTSVGYATRSHGLAQGIIAAGWDIRPYTRPGFPFDFKPELEGQNLPEQDLIDEVTYRRIFATQRRGTNEVQYLLEAIRHYEKVITEEQPEVVHAASNYVTALPALIAARRLGVPFVYEVRGFWEVTRSSRDEAFEHTPKYRWMQMFEALVAKEADQVITITSAMEDELVARGVAKEKIVVSYNSVDPERFRPIERDLVLAAHLGITTDVPVIGYVGSFVDYEGLDDLITACASLAEQGVQFVLLLVGDGAAHNEIRDQVEHVGLSSCTFMVGRVPHEQVEKYYSLIDIAPFPRKPWEVCELVSPLKPLEAMALEKIVIGPNTKAIMEIISHEKTGLLYEKGNLQSLQEALSHAINDVPNRKQLGTNAREWIKLQRSWQSAGEVCLHAYEKSIHPPGVMK